jgi:hypothetical protein
MTNKFRKSKFKEMNEEKSKSQTSCCDDTSYHDCSDMIKCMKSMFNEFTKDDSRFDCHEWMMKFRQMTKYGEGEETSDQTE